MTGAVGDRDVLRPRDVLHTGPNEAWHRGSPPNENPEWESHSDSGVASVGMP